MSTEAGHASVLCAPWSYGNPVPGVLLDTLPTVPEARARAEQLAAAEGLRDFSWRESAGGIQDLLASGRDTDFAVVWREPAHLWPCGCLINDAGAHRVGCPDHPEGVRG